MNWIFKDVVSFLRQHFFELSHTEGSHHYFRGKVDNEDRLTWIPNHGSKSIPPLTLKCAIHKSGIPESVWKKWANNGRDERVKYEGAVNWGNDGDAR